MPARYKSHAYDVLRRHLGADGHKAISFASDHDAKQDLDLERHPLSKLQASDVDTAGCSGMRPMAKLKGEFQDHKRSDVRGARRTRRSADDSRVKAKSHHDRTGTYIYTGIRIPTYAGAFGAGGSARIKSLPLAVATDHEDTGVSEL